MQQLFIILKLHCTYSFLLKLITRKHFWSSVNFIKYTFNCHTRKAWGISLHWDCGKRWLWKMCSFLLCSHTAVFSALGCNHLFIHPFIGALFPRHQFLVIEPESDLFVGTLDRVTAMADVSENIQANNLWSIFDINGLILIGKVEVKKVSNRILQLSSPANINTEVATDGAWQWIQRVGGSQYHTTGLHYCFTLPHLPITSTKHISIHIITFIKLIIPLFSQIPNCSNVSLNEALHLLEIFHVQLVHCLL